MKLIQRIVDFINISIMENHSFAGEKIIWEIHIYSQPIKNLVPCISNRGIRQGGFHYMLIKGILPNIIPLIHKITLNYLFELMKIDRLAYIFWWKIFIDSFPSIFNLEVGHFL
jgi:hypothetical protein